MKVVVLTGGVGGAKLVLGLTHVLPPENVTAIVNTGDDFRHLGLHISPDIDTLLYTLSGKANAAQGWGREGETWGFMSALRELGGEDWFQLGDQDLGLHVLRSHWLAAGATLSDVTRRFAEAWGIGATIVPMSDAPVRTELDTDIGRLAFQNYFVERSCAPIVRSIAFAGAETASPTPAVEEALDQADAVLIAPSNPFLSIDPILAIDSIRARLEARRVPAVAVSPIVGGQAVKGPTAKLMAELELAVSNQSIANHYAGMIDGLLIQEGDDLPDHLPFAQTDTMMRDFADKERVAREALTLAERLRRK